MRDSLENSILQTELDRLHALLVFADQKIAFIFILYSAIFWFFFKNLSKVFDTLDNIINNILLFSILFFLIYGFIHIYLVILPRLKNTNRKPLLYFWYIANLKLKKFKKKIANITDKKLQTELIEQIHMLSVINSKKMMNISKAILSLIFIFFTSIMYLLVNFELFLWKQ